jgi:hypothetical protein
MGHTMRRDEQLEYSSIPDANQHIMKKGGQQPEQSNVWDSQETVRE